MLALSCRRALKPVDFASQLRYLVFHLQLLGLLDVHELEHLIERLLHPRELARQIDISDSFFRTDWRLGNVIR